MPEPLSNFSPPLRGIHKHVASYIRAMPDLNGKLVVDIPCGDGRTSKEFLDRGATVKAFDLFPDFMALEELEAEYADLAEPIPMEANSADIIICQEGIEHIPNQLAVLEDFNRILKPGGTLLVTTPSNSHMRARLSHFLFESDYWKRMPPTEIDSIWFADENSDKLYFGHLFLMGVQHFESLVAISGFKTLQRRRSQLGNTSLLLGAVLYPLLLLTTLLSYFVYRQKNSHVPAEQRKAVLWRRVKLNLSPTTLFYKFIFWELRKDCDQEQYTARLRALNRDQ